MSRSDHPAGGGPQCDSYAFADGVRFRTALETCARSGVAFVPGALTDLMVARLSRDLRNGALSHASPSQTVPDEFTFAGADVPTVAALRDTLADHVQTHGAHIRGLRTWAPNEVCVRRYRQDAGGAPSHRDDAAFRRLVAVFTVKGTARVSVQSEPGGDDIGGWDAGPGSLLLLRGPGLGGVRDGRPAHAVSAPANGQRLSATVRMNTRT